MKKTVFAWCRFVPALLLMSVVCLSANAQKADKTKADKGEVTIRIIERNGDNVRETERTYRRNGMSDDERDKLVSKLVDSLKTTRKGSGKQQMTIIVEDNDELVVTQERTRPKTDRQPGDAYAWRNPRRPQNFEFEFRREMDTLADRMSRFRFQMPRDWDRQIARPFEDWARNAGVKQSTIRGLEAYPNNPDRNQLNVRFTAPAKGDISIVVTTPKGKDVARRDIKDFSGEFVGQIDLGKNAQGVYFITVTQNEDGAVKRVVVGE